MVSRDWERWILKFRSTLVETHIFSISNITYFVIRGENNILYACWFCRIPFHTFHPNSKRIVQNKYHDNSHIEIGLSIIIDFLVFAFQKLFTKETSVKGSKQNSFVRCRFRFSRRRTKSKFMHHIFLISWNGWASIVKHSKRYFRIENSIISFLFFFSFLFYNNMNKFMNMFCRLVDIAKKKLAIVHTSIFQKSSVHKRIRQKQMVLDIHSDMYFSYVPSVLS